tara:strand:- start:70 stop:366 length:297 start_codon:yes stop_codon:yes gene_type:complete
MKKLKWLILRWLLGEKYERGSGDVLAMIYSLGGSVSDNTNDIMAIKRDTNKIEALEHKIAVLDDFNIMKLAIEFVNTKHDLIERIEALEMKVKEQKER